MAGLKTRLIRPVGWQRTAYVHWLNEHGCAHRDEDGGVSGAHCAERRIVHVADVGELWPPDDEQVIDRLKSGSPLWTPTRCEKCGTPTPDDAQLGMNAYTTTRWDTPTGWPDPGSLYYKTDARRSGLDGEFPRHEPFDDPGPMRCIVIHTVDGDSVNVGWTNCDGQHLVCVTPDGVHWDIDSRANNCTMPDDTLHRCWVRVGDPRKGEPVHISKDGVTCAAGAGSIQTGSYHGFLHHGMLNPT